MLSRASRRYGKMRVVNDSELVWISWEEASNLTGIRVPTIEHATRVNRIKRRPARGILPSLDRGSVLEWADWQREQVAQREARRREREEASVAKRRLRDALRPKDRQLGPPEEGSWLSLPAAAQRLDVGVETIRRWLDDERLEGVQRAQRWVTEESVDRIVAHRRADADTWISMKQARAIVGHSDLVIARLVTEGLIVQRPGPRGQASINRQSAEKAGRVLFDREQRVRAEREHRADLRRLGFPPDDGHVWLSVKTAALILGLSESGTTLRIRSGRLPATRRARRWWIRREDAEQAAAARAFEARRNGR